ncbi:NADP-dependent oxidoreductase [Methylobacterium soli]|uniref:NADP-dependent oxidoreductase n=2 Tax=Methylobacterium soli TaxID=553447 RepID=A0A6L3SX80_9HYPH|nr:NADP-dependent oxidoreductase [Methylobacterium soli]KAB1072942.1 NADP-dependent oxidoreductase [Methylobacterium soli]
MMAWRVHAFGPPTVMSFESMAQPDPGEGEVLVRVHAAGVGPWDGWIRAGRSALPQPLPLTLGSDLSGVVEAVGPSDTGFAAGDEVFGVTNPRFVGAYAEYAVASAPMLARKTRSLTHVQAASVPVIAVTAWQGLFEQARLQPGQTVLIHGGAGNVGAYAVQLAHRAGLHTIATAGANDFAYVQSLGADRVMDYRAQRFEDEVHEADAVLDLVGGETQTRSFKVLRRDGRLVSAVSQPDQLCAERHGVTAEFFLVRVTTEHLSPLAELLESGELKTRVGAALPLARAREAHFMLEGEQAAPKGKIVLEVSPD